jgi:uncharacterized protein
MKLLLVLAAVYLGIWLWRSGRLADKKEKASRPTATAPDKDTGAEPATMVTCPHCGLHFPQTEAVPGKRGDYCSAAHRQQAEA